MCVCGGREGRRVWHDCYLFLLDGGAGRRGDLWVRRRDGLLPPVGHVGDLLQLLLTALVGVEERQLIELLDIWRRRRRRRREKPNQMNVISKASELS